MKKILFILLFFPLLLTASSKQTVETKIYLKIITTLFPSKDQIKVWSDDHTIKEDLQNTQKISIVKDLKKADMAIVKKQDDLQCSCVLFTIGYNTLKEYKTEAVGGFFWQKGRPNVIFLKKNLLKKGLSLPKSMQQYVEDSL